MSDRAVGDVARRRLGCAASALLLALGATGCGSGEGTAEPSPSASSPSASSSSTPSPSGASPSSNPGTPPGLDTKPPTPPETAARTATSAEEWSRWFAAVVQHAVRIRDPRPVTELARDPASCDSCRGIDDYIKGLKKDKLWELADDLEVGRVRVQPTGASTFRVTGPAVYPRISFVGLKGKQQSKQDISNYLFAVDLHWSADRDGWQVEDFSLINKGKKKRP